MVLNRMKNRGNPLMCLGIILMGIQLFWGGAGIAHGAGGEMPPVAPSSKAAPDFELRDMNGAMIRLSSYKGERSVLLYFWATWCPYCIVVKPEVAKLREKIEPNEMEILAINVGSGDSLEKVKRYQENHPVTWPVLYDGSGSTAQAYQIQGIPLFVLIDKEGNIAYRGNKLPEDLARLLK